MPKRGSRRVKRRTQKPLESLEAYQSSKDYQKDHPRSLVFRKGKIPHAVRDLIPDLRQALMPHTAERLKERRSNTLKDYLDVASTLAISHFWIFSSTDVGSYIRIGRVPRGPTLSFRLIEYSHGRDVRSIQRRPVHLEPTDTQYPPLLVLNNFSSDAPQVKIMKALLENLFPPLNIQQVKLSQVRRIVLFDYDSEKDLVYFRHYALKIRKAGLSKPIRKLILRKKVPKLTAIADVAEWVESGGFTPGYQTSDSEGDIPENNQFVLPQNIDKDRKKGTKSGVRLVEVGPRMTLNLIKIQDGLCEGSTIYHKYEKRTDEEIRKAEVRRKQKEFLKEKRKKIQEENVKRKQLEKAQLQAKQKKQKTGKSIENDSQDDQDKGDDENGFEIVPNSPPQQHDRDISDSSD